MFSVHFSGSQAIKMRFPTLAVFSLLFFKTLGSPFPKAKVMMRMMMIMMTMIMILPEAEADPRLVKVIKTVQVFDDEDQAGALEDALLEEDSDIIGLNVEYEVEDEVEDTVDTSYGLSEEIDLSPVNERAEDGGYHDHDDIHDDDDFQVEANNNNNSLVRVGSAGRNGSTFTTSGGLECVKKVMMTEYTEFQDTVTCVHKSEERCHQSYVTDFVPAR